MEVVVLILKIYFVFTICVMLIYSVRHFTFTMNRLFSEQRAYYQDIIDSELKNITVIVPMHNEEKVARQILDLLLDADYPPSALEIIPINDFSSDATQEILNGYARRYPLVKPLHRYEGARGKPAALNEAIARATGEIIIVFDADYLPPKSILKDIAVSFSDPEIGAVMGRVIPINTGTNMLTRLLDLERTGGYQVDQQARYNLKLVPQYGGTVGGFRKEFITTMGGFDSNILAEDTELTFRLLVSGWKVIYANRAECYEEAPEDWSVRARQIMRWSRGHTQVMFKYFFPMLESKYLSRKEKIDGALLLFVYTVPIILLLGLCDSLALFFLGEMHIIAGMIAFVFVGAYNTFGNFAPFYQIGIGSMLDGAAGRILLLPFLIFNFFFNTWYMSRGFVDAVIDKITGRIAPWQKTVRYRTSSQEITQQKKGVKR
jgi:cellulose synthase/poly-beta-1,6-N-acetylglucosamine synthase-like glycosyltransferase